MKKKNLFSITLLLVFFPSCTIFSITIARNRRGRGRGAVGAEVNNKFPTDSVQIGPFSLIFKSDRLCCLLYL